MPLSGPAYYALRIFSLCWCIQRTEKKVYSFMLQHISFNLHQISQNCIPIQQSAPYWCAVPCQLHLYYTDYILCPFPSYIPVLMDIRNTTQCTNAHTTLLHPEVGFKHGANFCLVSPRRYHISILGNLKELNISPSINYVSIISALISSLTASISLFFHFCLHMFLLLSIS